MPATSPTWPFTPWIRAASLPLPPVALRGTELLLETRRPLQPPSGYGTGLKRTSLGALVRKLQLPQNAWMLRITGRLASILRDRDSSSQLTHRWAFLILRDQEGVAGVPAAVAAVAGLAVEEPAVEEPAVGRAVEERAVVAAEEAEE